MRLFHRLAAQGSFSAAARDLKIKQSTASKWVAELEGELGVRLVDRTTRALRLTEAGRRFLSRSAEVLAAFDATVGDLADNWSALAGRVRISVPVVFGRVFVVPVLAEFLRKHPAVAAELAFNDRYVRLVDEGFDMAVRVGVPTDSSARGRKVADGKRRVVAAPSYLESRGWPRSPSDLAAHDCVVHEQAGQPTIWRFGRAGEASVPVSVAGRISASNSEAALAFVRAGLGIALLADWLVADDVAQGRVVSLLDEHSTPPAPVFVLMPEGRHPTALVRALGAALSKGIAARMTNGRA
jgi:DNA-binding transcriptional LysR family regulator